ncbi:hypothetical protein [Oenococcus kitaharae]|uniref:Uncharacterized protein n=1 Tax=Oenococcus kitaharae DSM 17330 TaxID=1045004 RepID=G9WFU2_9LACO|nr:hypothetical protein [Oenococcus kitaharae]EHN59465.1 hypothetical protein OKIT_1382 [Oenococcus kitaharae DSM 17330]MCV3295867.1 hypothetical protein [Oenococcus kitaharae]
MAKIQKLENDQYKELEKYFVMPEDNEQAELRKKALGQKDRVKKTRRVDDKEKK